MKKTHHFLRPIIASFLAIVMMFPSIMTSTAVQPSPEPAPGPSVLVVDDVVNASGLDTQGGRVCAVAIDTTVPEQCADWLGEPLRFEFQGNVTVKWTLIPPVGSHVEPTEGTVDLTPDREFQLTIQAPGVAPTATVESEPSATTPSETAASPTLTADPTVSATPTATATVAASTPSGNAPASTPYAIVDPASPAAGRVMAHPFAAAEPGNVTFTILDPNGQPVTSEYTLCINFSDRTGECAYYPGGPAQFTGAPGRASFRIIFPESSPYGDVLDSVDIVSNTTVNKTVQLRPRPKSQIAVHVATVDGQPVPAGTTVCYEGPRTNPETVCVTAPANGIVTFPGVQDGGYRITVTPPAGSGYATYETYIAVPAGQTARVDVKLARIDNATVTITVGVEDYPTGQVPPYTYGCVTFENGAPGDQVCRWVGSGLDNGDGTYTLTFPGPAGSYTWFIESQSADYVGQSGIGTVTAGSTSAHTVIMKRPTTPGTVQIIVTTADGSPVPADTLVCMTAYFGAEQCTTVGDNVSTSVTATFTSVMEGNGWYSVFAPRGIGYFPVYDRLVVVGGQTASATAVLRPYGENAVTKSIDQEQVLPGESVTYYIRGSFSGYTFTVSDPLPANFTLESVVCAGDFVPADGTCYDVYNNTITVRGTTTGRQGGSYAIIVTGTVTGAPGDDLVNTACAYGGGSGGSSLAPSVAMGVSSSTGPQRPTDMFQEGTTTFAACTTETRTLAAPGEYAMLFDKSLTTINGGAPGNEARLGDVLGYTFTVTNIGSRPLTGVNVDDPRVEAITCDQPVPATLAPQQTLTCTGTHTVDQINVDRHTFVNTATAISAETPPESDTAIIEILEPVRPAAPIVAQVCGPNNDSVTVPTQPTGVTYETFGWEDGEYTVRFIPVQGYSIVEPAEYTFEDANISCSGPSPTATTTATVVPVTYQPGEPNGSRPGNPTGSQPGDPTGSRPGDGGETPRGGQPGSGGSRDVTSVSKLPSTGSGPAAQWTLTAALTLAVSAGLAGIFVRTRRAR